MRIFAREQVIRRNDRLARGLVYGGLIILAIGLGLSFLRPEAINLVLLGALLGTLSSQVGLALMNRWSRRPRVDEVLDHSLKGMDRRTTLLHYALGVDHALLSPSGIYALFLTMQNGDISVEGDTWHAETPRQGLLRRGGRRKIRSLDRAAQSDAQRLAEQLKRLDIPGSTPVQPLIVFAHPDARLSTEASVVPAVHVKQLKGWLRKQDKAGGLDKETTENLLAKLDAAPRK